MTWLEITLSVVLAVVVAIAAYASYAAYAAASLIGGVISGFTRGMNR